MEHTPLLAQILFFGALLSAILSTASGTLLAPSTLVAKNLIEQIIPPKDDQQQLRLVRLVVVIFGICVLLFARYKSDLSIFQMVENAYKITLCGAFVPLVFGLYWRKANTTGALWSIGLGVGVWVLAEALAVHYAMMDGQSGWALLKLTAFEEVCPPQLAGFVASVLGMLIGSAFGARQEDAQITSASTRIPPQP